MKYFTNCKHTNKAGEGFGVYLCSGDPTILFPQDSSSISVHLRECQVHNLHSNTQFYKMCESSFRSSDPSHQQTDVENKNWCCWCSPVNKASTNQVQLRLNRQSWSEGYPQCLGDHEVVFNKILNHQNPTIVIFFNLRILVNIVYQVWPASACTLLTLVY